MMAAAPAPNWFVALKLPDLPGWDALTAGLPSGLRPFAAADRHLTLAFLGPCGEQRAREAWRSLLPRSHPPIEVAAAGWRAMGPPRRPSAYALTLGPGSGAVAELIRAWGDLALAAAGLPPESRDPLPHITLARPPRRLAASLRRPMRAWMAAAAVPREPFRLERLALYGWSEDRPRRLFRVLAERRLDSPESGHPLPGAP